MTTPQSLQNKINAIGEDATSLQNKASNPTNNIWVGASAGTGKTKVLTDRVLRLLLPVTGKNNGTPPQNILCITFTKAGANEMISRVMKILSYWAVCEEHELNKELESLLGYPPSIHDRDKARRLFAQVIDTPGGLNITTIHAFCQSVLGRFTIEAGLPPNFTVMDEVESQILIKNSRNQLIQDVIDCKSTTQIKQAFEQLSLHKNGEQIDKIFKSILGKREKINELIKQHKTIDGALSYIKNKMNINENETPNTVFTNYFDSDYFPVNHIQELAQSFKHGTQKKDVSPQLLAFCNSDINTKKSIYKEYMSVFLTKEGNICSSKKLTKDAQAFNSNAVTLFNDEAERLKEYEDKIKDIKVYNDTACLLYIGFEIIEKYNFLKNKSQKLDYDDLIHKTYQLLNSDMKDWVLYKLDYKIDHILIDEAQDTSPDQWTIIMALLHEFYSGFAVREEDIDRSVFIVGDIKQSIFSFQGADPSIFEKVQKQIEVMVESANKPWEIIPMNTSFRSTSAILELVDGIFSSPEKQSCLSQNNNTYTTHTAHRQGQSGRIDLWPIYRAPKEDKNKESWQLPTKIIPSFDSQSALAKQLANQIHELISTKEILKSTGDPIQAGDIMILVKQRNIMVEHLIKSLKDKNIPVSGADRLVVANHIAVKDVLSAIKFALMPDDDLSFASLLKSPFINWNDDTIESYAYTRTGTLWQEIKSNGPKDIVDWLLSLISKTPTEAAFSCISDLLNLCTPNNNYTGWQAMMSRLGKDAFDPLDEVLTQAQNFDIKHAGSGVQAFLPFLENNNNTIKRELDSANNMVRIMTVHASKGLQSPIVILPGTTSLPKKSGQSDDGFLWIDDDYPLWSMSSDNQNNTIKNKKEIMDTQALEEHNRLLYVALTRAEDRLIICGSLNKKQTNIPDNCWYESVSMAMPKLNNVKKMAWEHDNEYTNHLENSDYLSYETDQEIKKETHKSNLVLQDQEKLPTWCHKTIKPDQQPPKILSPSKLEDDDIAIRSPLLNNDNDHRFKRGILTHSLLQYLPDIKQEKRNESGENYLKIQAPDISTKIKESILSEVISILNNPEFSPFFGDGSLPEVPITGTVENKNGKIDIISGKIDRLLVTDETVWIIDFKSNRPPPTDLKNIPRQYKKQLHAYKILVKDIYPKHEIKCALLWTDGPIMMEVK